MKTSQRTIVTAGFLLFGLGLATPAFAINGCTNQNLAGTYNAQITNAWAFTNVLNTLKRHSRGHGKHRPTGTTGTTGTTGSTGSTVSARRLRQQRRQPRGKHPCPEPILLRRQRQHRGRQQHQHQCSHSGRHVLREQQLHGDNQIKYRAKLRRGNCEQRQPGIAPTIGRGIEWSHRNAPAVRK